MRQQPPVRKPEVMSPAGYWPQLHAAIEAGADAVYFGLKHFSARAKVGFTLTELPSVMRELHTRGVRGYITFNTLIFEHEIAEAAGAIAAIVDAGADALIMQDYGMVRLARQIAPAMELHASTQMSITDAAGVRQAQELGVQRVTLARELALTEVRSILEQTACELEIFVHGALCVAYSGQCFSSEAWGGRSANRGQCAQACRLPYEMLVDGRLEPLADARYLLSPGDLYGLHQVPEIVSMGVSALKIEGRYKDADYVALATAAYRKAVDEAAAGRKLSITPVEELQLEQVYSRGFGPFFLNGTNHQAVVDGRAPRHRGVCIGEVTRVSPDSVTIQPSAAHKIAPVKPGDGLVFDAASWRSPEEPEEGGRIFQALPNLDGSLELKFGNNAVRFARIRPGDLVWRTHDPALERVAKPYLEPAAPVARQPLHVRVTAAEGAPLVTEWTLAAHPEITTTVLSPEPVERAQNRGLTPDYLRDQFARLGNTPYTLESLELTCTGTPFAASSLLNRLRREAVEQLQALQANRRHPAVNEPGPLVEAALRQAVADAPPLPEPQIHLLVRTPEQLDAALELAPASITLDYLDLYGLRPSVDKVKAAGIAVRVASPRILKPGEARITNFLLSLDCPLVIRSTGILHALRQQPHADLIGDFSLNTANSLTASAYFELGLARLTPTHDLNADQIARLARIAGAARIEVIAYQHLPVFHTEHCVFCRFLSTGTTYKDCGRPCETHTVALKDPTGRAHPVMADVGCRNTVFGAEAQEASSFMDQWRDAGIRHFRLEFVHESAAQVRAVTKAFQTYLKGESTAAQLAAELKRIAPQGVTQGSLFVPPDYLTLPILQ
ncbi:MAG: DUF3656 domain-containing protein [Paludibaculum sp.]